MRERRKGPWPLALLALGAPLACQRAVPEHGAPVAAVPAPPAPAPPLVAPPDPGPSAGDAKAALAWLDALRERDPGALLEKIVLPFDFRDARLDARKKCGSRLATTLSAAKSVATCLATDPRFHAELSATPEPRLFALEGPAFPPWAKAWAGTVRPGLRALSSFVHGDADARELVLLVGDDGVHGVWQNLTIEPK